MNKKSGSGAGLFMMEMILVVFFFILCASTCILVFVKANNMSKLASDMNQGVLAAESIAEIWKSEGTNGLVNRLDAQETTDGSFCIVWDENWNPVQEPVSGFYQADITLSQADPLVQAQISLTRIWDQEALFDMKAASYEPAK